MSQCQYLGSLEDTYPVPSTPVDTLTLSHWKSRAMPMMATEIFERSFFVKAAWSGFNQGKQWRLKKTQAVYSMDGVMGIFELVR